MPRSRDDGRISVLHFGNDADSVRGGIAAVIRQHLSNSDDRLSVAAVPSYAPTGRSHWSRNAPYARALQRVVTGRRASDVAHVHVSQGGSLLREGVLAGLLRLRRVPVVVTLHGSSSLSNGKASFLLTGLVLRIASLAHFLSDAHRNRYGRFTSRSVTLPNAVHVARHEATDRQPDVVFAGVVGTRKGVDLLLEAWQSLPRGEWTLHLYGPPDSEFPLPRDIPGVVAHGEVAPAAVQGALASASIAVLPSREEAFPMFLVEAMAHGCAIVATDVGGVRELMGDAGLLVPADDAGALAAALSGLIDEPGRRAELARAASARAAERFDAAAVARRWAETYASLAARTPGAREGGSRG